MPKEPSDNTKVIYPIPQLKEIIAIEPKLDELWDADKVEKYQNLQNFYNNNFWGYGVGGKQTNINPRTPEGLAAIQANFDYAKGNVLNFAENLLTAGVAEGTGQVIKWATTPTKIGQGAEAVVSSAPISPMVTKVTTIPRSEMHVRNMVPGVLRSDYVSSANGLTTYIQPKVRILSKEKLAKAVKTLEKIMSKKGWRKITHPNLEGPGFTNGKWVVSDIGPGNVGKDWLGRVRLTDFAIESVPEFRIAMLKRGGKLIKGENGLSFERKLDILKHTYRTDTLGNEDMIPVTYDTRIETYKKYPQALDSDFDYFINKGHGTYLPNKGVTVTAYRPLHLITYYPIIHPSYDSKYDNYPLTGHSEIVSVCSKDSGDSDYNLLTNNCSDETREYLEAIFKKLLDPFLFTTPGDVRDFALDNGGHSINDGRDIFIPMTKERWNIVRDLAKKKSKLKFNKN